MRVLNQTKNAATGEASEEWIDLPDVLTAEQAEPLHIERCREEVRAERNARLAACDWVTLPDVPLTESQRETWTAYRQALRDVTDQAGFPSAINWPEAP